MTSLTGKTALVTGASRGIGRAIAQRLAADGATVAVHYGSNDAAAAETIDAIHAAGGEAFAVRAQLGVDGDVDTLFAALQDGLGGRPLDILVNNAAIATYEATIDQATPEQFDREFAINVRAPFFITQRALPLLRDGGRIINISSGVTWFATPQIVYSMTKGALNVLGRSLANIVGERGITVNNVSPGITDTDMNSWLHESDDAASGCHKHHRARPCRRGGGHCRRRRILRLRRQPLDHRRDRGRQRRTLAWTPRALARSPS